MKLIAISALALGLAAFGAQAQQRDQDDAINKGSSTSTAQPGTPSSPTTGMEEKSKGNPDKKTVATPDQEASSTTEVTQAGQSDQLKVKKHRKGSQARTGSSARHRAKSSSSADLPPSSDNESSAADRNSNKRGDLGEQVQKTGGISMLKALIAAVGVSLATPAFAQQTPLQKDMNDASKDVRDASKDAVDKTKDTLGTDSGATKAKRKAEQQGRKAKRKVRHMKHNARHDLEAKTNK